MVEEQQKANEGERTGEQHCKSILFQVTEQGEFLALRDESQRAVIAEKMKEVERHEQQQEALVRRDADCKLQAHVVHNKQKKQQQLLENTNVTMMNWSREKLVRNAERSLQFLSCCHKGR